MKFKRKKVKKYRGSTFHGYGRGAAHHKGAGNRGGRGRAGSGKRSDGKKPSFWKEVQGKNGFHSKSRMNFKCINLEELERSILCLAEKGFAVKKQSGYEVDLVKAGYDKLLGKGAVSMPLFITTNFSSKNAVERVKEAGGDVKTLKKIVKKEKKKPEAQKAKKKEETADDAEE